MIYLFLSFYNESPLFISWEQIGGANGSCVERVGRVNRGFIRVHVIFIFDGKERKREMEDASIFVDKKKDQTVFFAVRPSHFLQFFSSHILSLLS